MGSTADAPGTSHWRGTKRASCSCHGQALGPGPVRLTWSASKKHRCRAGPPGGPPVPWEHRVLLNLPARPAPLPQHQACPPAGPPELGRRGARAPGTVALPPPTPLVGFLGRQVALQYGFRTSQAQNAAPGWEGWRQSFISQRGRCVGKVWRVL